MKNSPFAPRPGAADFRGFGFRSTVPLCVAGLWLSLTTAGAGGLYWTNRGASLVERSAFDGTARATVLSSAGSNVRGIALDVPNNRIYYADNGADIIYKMNLDGTNRTTVLALGTNTAFPADLRLNLAAGHLYFCDQQNGRIRRINLDGTGAVNLVTDTTYQPYYLDLELGAGKIYWGDFDGVSANTGNVFRMNLDGTGRETIVTGNLETRAVCVDAAGGMLYWVNRNAGKIMRCKLSDLPVSATDATKVQTLYANLDTPHGMVLDIAAGKLYWVDTGTNGTPGSVGARAISRGTMDGTAPQEVIVNLGSEPWDIDFDPRVATYAEWVLRFFMRDPGATAAPASDPDNDGIPNLIECALGMSPLRPDLDGLPIVLTLHEGGLSYPAIRFRKRPGITGLSVLPQHGTGLDSWWDETSPTDEIAHLTLVSTVPQPDGLDLVTLRSIFPLEQNPRQFLRVKVVLQ